MPRPDPPRRGRAVPPKPARPRRTDRTAGGRPEPTRTSRRRTEDRQDDVPRRKGWGSVARKGARVVVEPAGQFDAKRNDSPRARARAGGEEAGSWQPDVWVREDDERPRKRLPQPRPGARPPAQKLADRGRERPRATTPASPRDRLEKRLADAARAYAADRYADARRLLKPLLAVDDPPPAVRELHGLTLYRMGKWSQAIAELEAFAAATGSYDQHPVLADCHRALRHWTTVEELWDEIRRTSPSPEVVAEGRIVAAGALADQGRVDAALRMLDRVSLSVRRPGLHHLRLWYARADLYERAGELPRARELFRSILRHDPDFVDAAERLAALE